MEIDADIEKLFSKKFSIKYYEKQNKVENGNMNFSPYEIMIQGKPVDGRIKTDKTVAYPEISHIIIQAEDKIVLDLSEKGYQLTIVVEEPLYIIKCIFVAFKLFFPCENVFTFMHIKNDTSLSIDSVKKEVENLNVHIQSPCNNFSFGIKFFAKYKYLPENEEIIWDIDTVYANKETNMFVLKDFDHLKPKFLLPVLGAMCYNTYFSELSLSFVDLTPYEKLLERVFKFNKKFKKLYFDGCNLKLSLCTAIASGLDGQKNLKCLDLSNNEGIGDKGVEIFTPFLKRSSRTLEVLKMSRCTLTSVSLSRIADAFTYNIKGNEDSYIELKVLDLSNNLLKDGFKEIFFDFLSKCCHLEDLNLANMNSSIEMIASSLLLGPINTLKFVDLSENLSPVSSKSCTQWSTFSKNAKSLTKISLSNFKSLHCSVTDGLMLGLEDNPTLSVTGVEVVISNSNFNLENFSRFVDFIYKARSVTQLDISSNGIGMEFQNLLNRLPEFSSLKSLNISNNFVGLKPKDVQSILSQMTAALQLESVNLQELYMCNCNFGSTLSTLISELDSFFSLRVLDISGNNIGNVVARTMGRMLTIDKHIKEIMMDNNNISKEIYEEILDGLIGNYTLSVFHVPFVDLVKYPPKLVIPIIERINKHHIKVNKIYQGVSFEDIKAMAFSCIMNQTSENIDKCRNTLQESCNRLKGINTNDDKLKEQITRCLKVSLENVRSMEASKELMFRLNALYKNGDNPSLLTDLQVKRVIETMSNDVSRLLNEYMENIVKEMLNETSRMLPYLLSSDEAFKEELKITCQNVMEIPREYLTKLLSRFIENNLMKKVYETQSNVTNAICDNITDHILMEMNTCDIQANRLINSSKTPLQSPQILEKKPFAEDVVVPVIRSTDEKKIQRDQLMSIRNSRASHLAASKARPLSKALKTITSELEDPPPKPAKPGRGKLVLEKPLNINISPNTDEPLTPEMYKEKSPSPDLYPDKPVAPARIRRLLTVTEGNHDQSSSQESISDTSRCIGLPVNQTSVTKSDSYISQDSLTEATTVSSPTRSVACAKKVLNLNLVKSTAEKTTIPNSSTGHGVSRNPTNLKINVLTAVDKVSLDSVESGDSVSESHDIVSSLRGRSKPTKNVKPKVVSPNVRAAENDIISEDGWQHFHNPEEHESESIAKPQSKKKSFFSLQKNKTQSKLKSKSIDFNNLGSENVSSSDSEVDEKSVHKFVKKNNSTKTSKK